MVTQISSSTCHRQKDPVIGFYYPSSVKGWHYGWAATFEQSELETLSATPHTHTHTHTRKDAALENNASRAPWFCFTYGWRRVPVETPLPPLVPDNPVFMFTCVSWFLKRAQCHSASRQRTCDVWITTWKPRNASGFMRWAVGWLLCTTSLCAALMMLSEHRGVGMWQGERGRGRCNLSPLLRSISLN